MLEGVQQLAGFLSLLGRHMLHLAKNALDDAFGAQESYAVGFELRRACRRAGRDFRLVGFYLLL